MRVILHLSDLHFGRVQPRARDAVIRHAQTLAPSLVVVSGDLTQRARPGEFREAREFLEALPGARLVIPGNHDIPLYHLGERFCRPFRRYSTWISPELEPEYRDEEMVAFGFNSVTRWKPSEGTLAPERLARARERIRVHGEGKIRVLVAHHPPLGMRGFERLLDGADLLLCGHTHQVSSGTSAHPHRAPHRSVIVAQAGTSISRRLRGESNSFNLIRIDPRSIEVVPWSWTDGSGGFTAGTARRFAPGEQGWAAA